MRLPVLAGLACLTLLAGCTRLPSTGVTSLTPATLADLQRQLLSRKGDLDLYRLRGPYEVTVVRDHAVQLSATESIDTDLYLSAHGENAPLVILLHGYGNSKEDHAYQALHLATWGMHSLCLQLPNTGPWIANGRTLARLVDFIHRHPETVVGRIDPKRIVLVGHSFGGSSVAVALADGAPAVGGILLDPAGIGKALPEYLGRIRRPVIVLGSDERVAGTRNRRYFYDYIRSEVAEISIAGAHHEDAQFPLEPVLFGIGTDTPATEDLQVTFVSALASSAFSLGFTGRLDYAWAGLMQASATGRFFGALRK